MDPTRRPMLAKTDSLFPQAPNFKSGLHAQNQRYGQRATPPPPAYRWRGLGRPPSGGRAAVSISSRPFVFLAGRRQVGQVASPPARSLSPARLESVFLREEPQPQPRSRAARAPRARLTRVRLAAGWLILCNKRRRGPPRAPPPPPRRPPALDPPAAPGQHPISTPLPTLSSTFPFTFTSSNPPPPAPRASCASTAHTPPKPPPVVELAHSCVLVASLVHILLSTTQLFRVRVRGGARAGSRGRPPRGAPRPDRPTCAATLRTRPSVLLRHEGFTAVL